MRVTIQHKAENRSIRLFIVQKGDHLVDDWKLTHEEDEPLVAIFDASYNTHTVPYTRDVLGYFIRSVPLSEFANLPKTKEGGIQFHTGIPQWSLDKTGAKKAMTFIRKCERELMAEPQAPAMGM